MVSRPAPTAPLSLHRDLPDGARYDLAAAAPGITTVAIVDPDGDGACIALDRAGVRRLIEDLTLSAGLTPTTPQLGRGAALAGSVQRIFALLEELDKTDSAAAAEIVAAIAAHLRSWRPMALLTAQVTP